MQKFLWNSVSGCQILYFLKNIAAKKIEARKIDRNRNNSLSASLAKCNIPAHLTNNLQIKLVNFTAVFQSGDKVAWH